jgi:hypothetical protein
MTKAKISEYDAVAANNTDVNGVNIDEGCAPSGMNNMGREIMAALKRFETGADGDSLTVGGSLIVSGTVTAANTATLGNVDVNGGTIDGAVIGGASAAAGSFTTLNTSGAVVFNDAGADVDFRVEGDTEANLLFVDASTDRVGIGTNAPSKKLQVAGDILMTGTDGIGLIPSTNAGSIYISRSSFTSNVEFGGTTSNVDIGSGGGFQILLGKNECTFSGFPDTANVGQAITLAERMRIDSDGNVGIGTSSPGSSGGLSVNRTSGTGAGLQMYQSDVETFKVITDNSAAYIQAIANIPMQFYTNNTERMRITSGGYFKASDTGVYFGATGLYHEIRNSTNNQSLLVFSTNASQTNDCFAVVADRNTTNNTYYAIVYYNDGSDTYRFRVADSGNVTNTNNSYGAISDVKLKQDIVDAASQWDDIKNLRVRKFHWKSDPGGFLQMGLVAQEAELVSPGLIDEHPDYEEVEVPVLDDEGNPVLNEDGTPQVTKERNALGTTTKAIKYSVLYMKAVKALQEAMERIETLEAKVAALEAK